MSNDDHPGADRIADIGAIAGSRRYSAAIRAKRALCVEPSGSGLSRKWRTAGLTSMM